MSWRLLFPEPRYDPGEEMRKDRRTGRIFSHGLAGPLGPLSPLSFGLLMSSDIDTFKLLGLSSKSLLNF